MTRLRLVTDDNLYLHRLLRHLLQWSLQEVIK